MKKRQRKRQSSLSAGALGAAGAALAVQLPLPPVLAFGIIVAMLLGFFVYWTMSSEKDPEEVPDDEVVQCPWYGYRTGIVGRKQVLCLRCGLASWDRPDRVADRGAGAFDFATVAGRRPSERQTP